MSERRVATISMVALCRFALLGLALLGLASCASAPAKRKVEMAELAGMLAGQYDNLEQVREAGEAANIPALRIAIVPIYAPLVGKDIFYMQEMAADDPRRVTAQRVLSLEVTPKGEILEGIFGLTEPNRWRDGHLRVDLFKSMLPDDLRLAEGCEITWKRGAQGFEGANDPARCRVTQRPSGKTVRQESLVEVNEEGIGFADTQIDSAGVRRPATKTWYRFYRGAH